MLQYIALNSLERAINTYVGLDPDSIQALSGLAHKVLALDVRGLPFKCVLYIYFSVNELQLRDSWAIEPHTTLCGTPLALAKLMKKPDPKEHSAFLEGVEIKGDVELGYKVQAFFHGIDIDWEEHLSRLIGDIPAHQLTRLVRDVTRWGKDSVDAMCLNISEYLQEEIKQVPPREELSDFFMDIDQLSMDSERLILRAKRLKIGENL